MTTMRGPLWLVAMGLLTACTQVEFQSPPSLPLAACDSALVGDWRVEDPKDTEPAQERIYLRVTEDCNEWLGIEVDERAEDGPSLKIEDLKDDMSLGFARAGSQRFVVSLQKSNSAQVDPEATEAQPESTNERPSGHVLVDYRSEDSALVFRLLDPQRVAHLIIDDVIPGWVEKRDRRPDGSADVMAKRFSVYVFGDAEQTSALLQAHELSGPPWLRLLPADPATRAAMDGWIEQAAAAEAAGDGGNES